MKLSEESKAILKNKIKENKIKEVINDLLKYTIEDNEINQYIILLNSQMVELDHFYGSGLTSQESYANNRNRIIKQLLSLVTTDGELKMPKAISTEEKESYFIFPGFRELLIGISILSIIEFLTGASVISRMPLQEIFTVLMILFIVELVCFIIIASEWESFNYITFLIVSTIFLAGTYGIGYLYPELAIGYPNNSYSGIMKMVILLYSVIMQLFKKIGFFIFLGSILLLIHLAQKYSKRLKVFLSEL